MDARPLSDCAAVGERMSADVSREQMRLVLDASRSLAVTIDLDTLLQRIARSATALLACERASVFLHDHKTDELWTTVALGSESIRVPSCSGIVGQAFCNNEIVYCGDAYGDSRFNPEPDRRGGFRTRDLLAAPMLDWDGRPVGVLQAVNKIASPFTDTDAALLRLLSDQAGVAFQRWTLQQAAIQGSGLKHEMQLARRVQEAMIPRHPPTIPGLCCAGWTRSASINGGDCYDLWKCGERLGVLVADASGHGMAPALVVSQVRALVRALCETEKDPSHVLARINDRLAADLEPGRFVTAFLGFMSSDGWLHWCSAGHGPIVVSQPADQYVFDACWPPLGIMKDMEEGTPAPIRLEPGGSLVVPSDGITEAFGPGDELFGVHRLIEGLGSVPISDPAAAAQAVRDAVTRWQHKEEPADDQTLVIVRRDS